MILVIQVWNCYLNVGVFRRFEPAKRDASREAKEGRMNPKKALQINFQRAKNGWRMQIRWTLDEEEWEWAERNGVESSVNPAGVEECKIASSRAILETGWNYPFFNIFIPTQYDHHYLEVSRFTVGQEHLILWYSLLVCEWLKVSTVTNHQNTVSWEILLQQIANHFVRAHRYEIFDSLFSTEFYTRMPSHRMSDLFAQHFWNLRSRRVLNTIKI